MNTIAKFCLPDKHGTGKYVCEVCMKSFRKPCQLQRHSAVHMKELYFECPTCLKRYSQKSSVQRHQTHTHKGEKKHECQKCQLRFAQKTNLLQHMQRTHCTQPVDVITYSCTYCTCTFSKLNSLNRHTTAQHSSEKYDVKNVFQDDDTPVDDPDALARNVLAELKQLQSGMQPTKIERVAEAVVTSKPKVLSPQVQSTELTIVDEAEIELVTLSDKLNPHRVPHLINVQRIRRSGETTYAYVCDFCAKECKTRYSFIRHRRLHTNERPYKCTYCECSYQTKSRLQQHAQIHCLDERLGIISHQHECVICERHYHSERQLHLHMSHSHNNTVNYTCAICQATFATQRGFTRHKHAAQQDAELTELKKLIPEPINLAEVIRQGTVNLAKEGKVKEPRFECTFCALNLQSRSQLVQHEIRHKRLKSYLCGTCGRCYSSKSALDVHQRIHTSHKFYTCAYCLQRSYRTNAQLQRHLLYFHSKIRNFKCVYCTQCFKSKQNCRSHMLTHLKRLLNESQAAEEDGKSAANITLSEVGIFAYSPVSPPKCQVIVQNTTPKAQSKFIEVQFLRTLAKHKQRNITVETLQKVQTSDDISATPNCSIEVIPQNACHNCSKQFQKPSDLQRHLRTHTQERPYACTQCQKSYALKSTLQTHLLTHQATRSKHGCQVCGKAYASKKVLTVHLRLHTGERPFRCEFCDKVFRTSGHRIAHMKAAKHANEIMCLKALENVCN